MTRPPFASRSLRQIALPLLALLAPFPLAAAPPISVDVVLEEAVPIVDDAYIYQTIVGDTQSSPARARLAIDLFLRNDEAAAVTIDHVTLDFDAPNLASIVLDTSLQMWCSGVADMMTGATGLTMPAGARCRLGLTADPLIALPAPSLLRINVAFDGIFLALMTPQRSLTSYQNSTVTGSYRFPAKAEDLAPGLYWSGRPGLSGEHHRFRSRTLNDEVFAHDLGVIRRDNTGTWRNYKELEAGDFDPDDENDDFLCWEQPVYAMADGIVRNFAGANADNPSPGTIPPGAQANFFLIEHGDETVWYGHFRQNSLNPALMSVNAVVKSGDLLGLVGNSGSSTQPHLHVHAVRDGDPMPLHFNDTFTVERDTAYVSATGNSPWNGHTGEGLTPSLTAIWPSALRRRGEATDVEIKSVAIAHPNAIRSLTAVRTAGDDLRISFWSTNDSGEAVLLDTETGGGVTHVALATPNGTQDGALAMITAAGNLKISALDLVGNTLTRTADYNSNPVQDVVASSAPFAGGIVTAVRTQFGNLKVMAWEVDPAGSSIAPTGEDVGGAIKDVAVARIYAFPGVVVAVRNSSDNLQLITFGVDAAGDVDREDDYEDAAVDQVSVARLGYRANGDDLVVTASRTAAGNLELISWAIDASGDITRLGDIGAGAIEEVSAASASSRHVLTAIGDANGEYKLIAWHVADDGTFVRRADSQGGAATAIAQEGAKSAGVGMRIAVTAMADVNGDLKLVVHQVLLTD